MKRCPKIGQRVKFIGNSVNGPCTGIVTAIYKAEEWDLEKDRPTGRLLPESQWSVCLEVDVLPQLWCYIDCNKITPQVQYLQRVRNTTPAR